MELLNYMPAPLINVLQLSVYCFYCYRGVTFTSRSTQHTDAIYDYGRKTLHHSPQCCHSDGRAVRVFTKILRPVPSYFHLQFIPTNSLLPLTGYCHLQLIATYSLYPLTSYYHLQLITTYSLFPLTAYSHLQLTLRQAGRLADQPRTGRKLTSNHLLRAGWVGLIINQSHMSIELDRL